MTITPVDDAPPAGRAMVRDTRYHRADVAKLLDEVVHARWLATGATRPKHEILDGLFLIAIAHADQLQPVMDKLGQLGGDAGQLLAWLTAQGDNHGEDH